MSDKYKYGEKKQLSDSFDRAASGTEAPAPQQPANAPPQPAPHNPSVDEIVKALTPVPGKHY